MWNNFRGASCPTKDGIIKERGHSDGVVLLGSCEVPEDPQLGIHWGSSFAGLVL